MNRFYDEAELLDLNLQHIGTGVLIDRSVVFLNPTAISINDHTRIDAFCLISAVEGHVSIGSHVHIAAGVYIYGGGGVVINDFAGLSARTTIYSTNDDYSGDYLTGPTVPDDLKNITRVPVNIGRHVVIGAGSIILPGISAGDGSACGALSLIKNDIAAFSLVAGSPARKIGERSNRLLQLEAVLTQRKQKKKYPTLQIQIPISPTPSFFTMVQYYAASLREKGGKFADAKLIVSVGDDCEPFDIVAAHPGLAKYNITWRWVDREEFRQHSYFATGLDRWKFQFESDYVLMADADMLIVGDFSDAIDKLSHPVGITGVVATYPPFMARGFGNVDRDRWLELFRLAGIQDAPFDCEHPGFGNFYDGTAGIKESPPYYNFGFVLGTGEAMNRIGATLKQDYELASDYMKTDLSAQAALSLSIVRNKVPYSTLPVRYNFWSCDKYLDAFPDEARKIAVLHYLYKFPFDKSVHIDSHNTIGEKLKQLAEEETPIAALLHDAFESAHHQVSKDLAGIIA